MLLSIWNIEESILEQIGENTFFSLWNLRIQCTKKSKLYRRMKYVSENVWSL